MDKDTQPISTASAVSDDNVQIQEKVEQEEEEEDEALSLRDFPITSSPPHSNSQPTSDLFAFSSCSFSSSDNISHADEIFSCGKLIPCKPTAEFSVLNKEPSSHHEFAKKPSEPMKNSSTDHKVLRVSRSLDDQKLYRRSSKRSMDSPKQATTTTTNAQWNSSPLINNYSDRKVDGSKPKWSHLMMFGPVKLRPEMELRDMKNRQGRRTPQLIVGKDKEVGSSWRVILDALSCKSHASLPVSTVDDIY